VRKIDRASAHSQKSIYQRAIRIGTLGVGTVALVVENLADRAVIVDGYFFQEPTTEVRASCANKFAD
jgi:hypothetical protein